jgi:hypothetical protein
MGAILEPEELRELQELERRLKTDALSPLGHLSPWHQLEKLLQRQRFFAMKASALWKDFDGSNWASEESRKQFLLFNVRALLDLEGILSVIGWLSESDRRLQVWVEEKVITFNALSNSILQKLERQLQAVGGQYKLDTVLLRDPVTGVDTSYEAFFWETSMSDAQLSVHLHVLGKRIEDLSTMKVHYVAVPGYHLRSQDPMRVDRVYHPEMRQLFLMMPLAHLRPLLPTDEKILVKGGE